MLGWKQANLRHRLDAYIVNYADDFVICCRGQVEKAKAVMRSMMRQLRLTVNETKTRTRRLPEETFDFLGYTFGRCYAFGSGRPYLAMRPSRKSIHRLCRNIHEATSRRWGQADVRERVDKLNHMMVGWANYFCLGPVSRAYANVDVHARHRLRQWLCRKHKQPGRGCKRYPLSVIHETLGLVRLERQRRIISWALA